MKCDVKVIQPEEKVNIILLFTFPKYWNFLCILFRLNEGKGQQQFEVSLKQLLQSITGMMCYNTGSTLLVQGACLKYLPFTIPDILTVFSATELR
jgi:hypothetical protein